MYKVCSLMYFHLFHKIGNNEIQLSERIKINLNEKSPDA
jgi:hypothetical protein